MLFTILPVFWALVVLVALFIGKEFGAGAILTTDKVAAELKGDGWAKSLNIATIVKGAINLLISFAAFAQYGWFLTVGTVLIFTLLDYVFDYWKLKNRLPSVPVSELTKVYNWVGGLKSISLSSIVGLIIKLHGLL